MASKILTLGRQGRNLTLQNITRKYILQTIRSNTNGSIHTEVGGMNSKPTQVRFGLLKTFAVVTPFLWAGAAAARDGAAWLEENDIFVPDDDDDD